MALTLVLDKISDLSEDVRKEYKKGSGEGQDVEKFYLDTVAADGLSVDTAQEFKDQLQKATTKHEAATAKLKDFDDLDPTKARDAIEKLAKMKDMTPTQEVKEKLRLNEQALEDKYKTELSDKDTKIAGLMDQVKGHTIDSVALTAINEHKGNMKLLMPLILQNTTVEEDDAGKWVARVMKADGTIRITPQTGKTHKMTVTELVEEYRKDDTFKACFAGAGAQGGGAGNEGDADRTVTKGGAVSASDQGALSANLEAIAKGEVSVVGGGAAGA